MSEHLKSYILHPELKNDNTLHVIGVIQNPVRYHSRYRLFRDWVKRMLETKNVQLHVVECTFGDRKAECYPQEGQAYNFRTVHSNQEIWLKECMINFAIKNMLPPDWRYVAWIDCDVEFENHQWALASIHALQHYHIIQPWGDGVHQRFDGGIFEHNQSLGYRCAKGMKIAPHNRPKQVTIDDEYGSGHTGFAWAITRYLYENMPGGLFDVALLGSGDAHIAWACLGDVLSTINGQMEQGFKDEALRFQNAVLPITNKMIGYVPGILKHWHHGPLKGRGYGHRWQIPIRHKYNPLKDIRRDHNGIIQLIGKPDFHRDIMRYNRSRCEDSIEDI